MRARQKVVEGARLTLRTITKDSNEVELFHENQFEGVFKDEAEALAYAREAILPLYRVGSGSVGLGRPKKWVSAERRDSTLPDKLD